MHTNAAADIADVDALGTPGPGAKKFFLFVGLLTIVPAIFYPLIYELEAGLPYPPFLLITIVNVITGSFHVGTSAYFYFDREYQPLMRGDRIRFYWCLALLPFGFLALGTTASALGGPQAVFWLLAGNSAWLFYHYQRQNFGLISLVNKNIGAGRLPPEVSNILNTVAAAGVLGFVGIPFNAELGYEVPSELHSQMKLAGMVLYGVSLGLLIRAFARHPHLRANPWLTCSILLGWAFFLPAVVFDSIAGAFIPLAVAHGAQYILMMTVVSRRSRRGWRGVGVMVLVGAAIGLSMHFALQTEYDLHLALFTTGVVMIHFVVDAKLWRLREPEQRDIMMRRFSFLAPAGDNAAHAWQPEAVEK